MTQFHKRHYERVAEAMQEATRRIEAMDGGDALKTQRGVALATAINELADVFAGDNGSFKRDRFLRACIPGANVRARS
jgi:hypothetical protein